jgi:hypothetical protein
MLSTLSPVYAHHRSSVVQLMIIGGAVTKDVGTVLKFPGGCGEDCGDGDGDGEEGFVTTAGVCARVCKGMLPYQTQATTRIETYSFL